MHRNINTGKRKKALKTLTVPVTVQLCQPGSPNARHNTGSKQKDWSSFSRMILHQPIQQVLHILFCLILFLLKLYYEWPKNVGWINSIILYIHVELFFCLWAAILKKYMNPIYKSNNIELIHRK